MVSALDEACQKFEQVELTVFADNVTAVHLYSTGLGPLVGLVIG